MTRALTLLVVLTPAAALATDFSAIAPTSSGWDTVSNANNKELGQVSVQLKMVGGVPCVRGETTVDTSADTLYEVVTDVPSAKKWSSETLIASKVLGNSGGSVEYYQHLDVPGWTMASDRFWVLKGTDKSSGNTKTFQWERFDWKSKYPELAEDLKTNHGDAVEPVTNYGHWSFETKDGKVRALYTICSDPGGSIPEWLKKKAATQTLPNTMADVVREARRRSQ